VPPTVVDALRHTNTRVRKLLARLRAAAGENALPSNQDFKDLGGELRISAVWLGDVPPGSMAQGDLAKEIDDYRNSLEELREILPAIQKRLLCERARMEMEAAHVGAASAWANASRGTL
jgi:hypothetical protein